MNTDSDPGGVIELDSPADEPVQSSEHQNEEHDSDSVVLWVPTGRRLVSGLLGLNAVLLGAALLVGNALNPTALKNLEPQVFLLLLMGVSVVWMLWYLLWARRQPGFCTHKDHHAGGGPVTCKHPVYYLIKYHIREIVVGDVCDCYYCHSNFLLSYLNIYLCLNGSTCCRLGLMVILSADLLLWLNAVTEETIHVEMKLEKEGGLHVRFANSTSCHCRVSAACLVFRKAIEILYPFHMEYYLMAGCMIYVMWKNVGRRTSPGDHHHVAHKLTLRAVYDGEVFYGLVFGGLVLMVGVVIFILYHIFVSLPRHRLTAFLLFYGYHLAVMPLMSLCSLGGTLVQRAERRASVGGRDPTRSLDVILLLATALGQLALAYFSLVAALAVGTEGTLGDLDLSYSVLSLLELSLQNIFIIKGLHRHPSHTTVLEGKTSAAAQERDGKKPGMKRAIQEICAFLILSNVMLWIIPAFGVHPQFENGIGKRFFGFSAWFVLVNLSQPLGVFYRMHSVGALMELLLDA
uniref:Otopetrin 3 n=1 Tax=Labrus bergylta TaxID=56723 RepID=A0A3Q3MQ98_9LABR